MQKLCSIPVHRMSFWKMCRFILGVCEAQQKQCSFITNVHINLYAIFIAISMVMFIIFFIVLVVPPNCIGPEVKVS